MFIEVKNLKKAYKNGKVQSEILKGVSFDVKAGEILTILGPSGSGKSTLLNLMGGLDTADSGSIKIDGTDIVGMSEKDLSKFRRNTFGFIYQFYNLVSDLNVYENVEVCHWLGDKSIKINDILDRVGMAENKKKFPDELSGGMQQRVSIARAIAKNPKILFCDEPTGALDYKTSKEILKLIEDVNKKYGNTVVLVTHNDAIKNMADRVIKLRDGQIRHDIVNMEKTPAQELDW